MADPRWELSRPPQNDMNVEVVIWPKMSINRSHLMATLPASQAALILTTANTLSLPLTYLALRHCLCLLPVSS